MDAVMLCVDKCKSRKGVFKIHRGCEDPVTVSKSNVLGLLMKCVLLFLPDY